MFSHRDTYQTLGGEGCPEPHITQRREIRKICGVLRLPHINAVQVLVGTSREHAGTETQNEHAKPNSGS